MRSGVPKPAETGVRRVVGFSGGADSQAVALWVRQRYPAEEIILLSSHAGRHEHPITDSFIQWYSDTIHPVHVITPLIRDLGNRGTLPGASRDRRREFADDDELTFDRLAYIKQRFPSRKAQFCTEYLKLAPQKRWCEEHLIAHGLDFERYIGVRRDESGPRARTPDSAWDPYFDCQIHYPIAAWSKAQVFAFLAQHGEETNPLYRMGFSRVGCAPCINSGKSDIRQWAARCPEMIDKVRLWEHAVGRTFFAPCVPGKAINWIDEVVSWAKTARGGSQFDLPMVEAEAAQGTCSSRYGLCE